VAAGPRLALRAMLWAGPLLASAVHAAPRGQAAPSPQARAEVAGAEEERADALERVALAFIDALEAVRRGDPLAEPSLERHANELHRRFGRKDAVDVAAYYLKLTPSERREGLALESRFDELRAGVQAAESSGSGATSPLEADLLALLAEARRAADLSPAARTAALLARIEVRQVERSWPGAAGRAELIRRAEEHAELALRCFELAGQRTPRLEALWVRARLALACGHPLRAEEVFRELSHLAAQVDRPRWRERALLGLVGVAREQGAPFAAAAALDELATFRHPARCWALTRELAAQRLSEDRPLRALELLESFPPSGLDPEIELIAADGEWRALQAAALLRAGDHERAAAALEEARRLPRRDHDGVLELTHASLLLDRGEHEEALAALDQLEASSDLSRVEALVLRGRTLLAAGQTTEAIAPLQLAFDEARARDAARRRREDGRPRDSSAVGEWLGLSTVEALARALAEASRPLEAAATIEAAHAACSTDEARARLLALAATQPLGLVTWIVGADRSLAIHVGSDGTAQAAEIQRGRQEVLRAARRLREALITTRRAPESAPRSLCGEIASEVLPPSLLRALEQWRLGPHPGGVPGVALLPHGALEQMPFEALPAGPGEGPMGLDLALTIVDCLREPTALPPPLAGPAASWVALGAPARTGLPDLPGARQELRDLARLHRRLEVLDGTDFDSEQLLLALGGDRAVHVATHVARTEDGQSITPLGLVTSEGRVVTAASIAAVAPRLPLLVLATCDSASGRAVDGLSTRGLAQVALDAGTRAVVVTGWSLSDHYGRTASLTFHASLRAGATAPEALRRARCALVAIGAPPAEWAALRFLGTP
jgi:hypothetical protein